jgi:hypothetical protein
MHAAVGHKQHTQHVGDHQERPEAKSRGTMARRGLVFMMELLCDGLMAFRSAMLRSDFRAISADHRAAGGI